MKQATISSTKLVRLVGGGFTYRQLDHWSRVGLLQPTVPARGSGTARGWSLDDALTARVYHALCKTGVPVTVDDRPNPALIRFADQLRTNPALWDHRVVVSPEGAITEGDGWTINLATHRAEIVQAFHQLLPVSAVA